MFDLDLKWDTASNRRIAQFGEFEPGWDAMNHSIAEQVAVIAEDYFKKFLNVRPMQTGKTKESITHTINYTNEGWTIEYHGLLSALYMDQGNFPAGEVLTADSKGLKMFPVDKRFGASFPAGAIHGMGSLTSGVPTHWSQKTVNNLSSTQKVTRVAANAMKEFLRTVVVR